MRWLHGLWVGYIVLLVGCSDTNGQTGSVGYGCSDEECQVEGQRWLDSVNHTSAPQFVGALCQEGGATAPLPYRSCKCIEAGGTFESVEASGPVGGCGSVVMVAAGAAGGGGSAHVEDLDPTVPCLALGRGAFACADPANDASCLPSDPHSCDAICSRLEQGRAEDVARHYDVALRRATCRPVPGGRPHCDFVASINGSCYASETADGRSFKTPHDCSLSDDQILALEDGIAGSGTRIDGCGGRYSGYSSGGGYYSGVGGNSTAGYSGNSTAGYSGSSESNGGVGGGTGGT